MSMIFLATGTVTMGMTKRDKDGKVVSSTPARFTWDDAGGSIAIGYMDAETKEIIEESVSIFGDWDAAGYLAEVLDLIKPRRPVNIPDFKAIIQKAYTAAGEHPLCVYCQGINCQDCIMKEWTEEVE